MQKEGPKAMVDSVPDFVFPDFEVRDLRRLPNSGGSSDAYEIAGNDDIVAIIRRSEIGSRVVNQVANTPFLRLLDRTILTRGLLERALSATVKRKEGRHPEEEKVRVREVLEIETERLNNGAHLCKKYLGDSFMECKFIVRDNQNGFPVIFRVQKKLPANCTNLANERVLQAISLSEPARTNLSLLLANMRGMIEETGIAVDILTLGNIAYDENTSQFYIFDADPLITSRELEEEKSQQYVVESTISNEGFKTATGIETDDCMEVTLEHLRHLQADICEEVEKQPQE